MTRRAPQRSTIQPTSGHDRAASAACSVSAEENMPRPTPSSAVIGFRNTPNANTLTAPPPTIRPQIVAKTIHQRLAKMPRIDAFLPDFGPAYGGAGAFAKRHRWRRRARPELPYRRASFETRPGPAGTLL